MTFEKEEIILNFLDELLLIVPHYGDFNPSEVFLASNLPDKEKASDLSDHIEYFLVDRLKYADGKFNLMLNDKGRTAKEAGGHFKYEDKLRRKARNEEILNWPKKYWGVSAIFAVIAFALPLYLKYCTKKSQPTSQLMPAPKALISDTTMALHHN